MYEPGPGDQLHDLNPSEPHPLGLFWTVPIPDASINVDFASGRATLSAQDVQVFDYGQISNALSGTGPPPQSATVSFRVEWSGSVDQRPVRNASAGFTGEFIRNFAWMEWSGSVGPYQFVSAPLASSSSSFAEIGQERNGMFFT